MGNYFILNEIQPFEVSDKVTTNVEVLRVGTIFDRNLKITPKMLEEFVLNYNDDVVGQQISVNKDHSQGEACGWISGLFVEGNSLMATVEWNKLGQDLIKDDLYKYVSCEFYDKYPRSTDGKVMKNVFVGLALTNTPAMKNQSPLMLSEIKQYNLTNKVMFEKLLKELLAKDTVLEADYSLAESLMEELDEQEALSYKEDMEALKTKVEESRQSLEEMEKQSMAEQAEKQELAEKVQLLEKEAEEKKALAEKVQLLEQEKRTEELTKLSSKVVLGQHKQVGVPAAKKDEVVAFMETLSEEQIETFVALMDSLESFQAGEVGAKVKATDKSGAKNELSEEEVDKEIADINAKAEKLSKETGRDKAEIIAELSANVLSNTK